MAYPTRDNKGSPTPDEATAVGEYMEETKDYDEPSYVNKEHPHADPANRQPGDHPHKDLNKHSDKEVGNFHKHVGGY